MTTEQALKVAECNDAQLWMLISVAEATKQSFGCTNLKEVKKLALDTLAARVRELEGRRCETCCHRAGVGVDVCDLSRRSTDFGAHRMLCSAFGNTCGAWEAK